MAPFVEREWGAKATELMWRIKRLADPDGVLGPGVVLNDDPGFHLKNLKTTPAIEEEVDDLRRVRVLRAGLPEPEPDDDAAPADRPAPRDGPPAAGSPVLAALLEEYEYDALETCAADGTCVLACPVGIDTGKLVKGLRARRAQRARGAGRAAARRALGLGRAGRPRRAARRRSRPRSLGERARGASRAARRALSAELVPEWPPNMPRAGAGRRCRRRPGAGAAAVYLPACVNRIFGRARNGADTAARACPRRSSRSRRARASRSGSRPTSPATAARPRGSRRAIATAPGGWRTRRSTRSGAGSDGGELPDRLRRELLHARACRGGGRAAQRGERRAPREARRSSTRSPGPPSGCCRGSRSSASSGAVAVHPPCSSRHLGLDAGLAALAARACRGGRRPPTATCCGFAGDRGLLHPELTARATADEAAELGGRSFDAHVCANRTCEIGLEQGTGRPTSRSSSCSSS